MTHTKTPAAAATYHGIVASSHMVLATAETLNFKFQTIADTQKKASRQLVEAWRRHCRDYSSADPRMMAQMIADGEISYVPIELGQTLRDGEVI